MDAIYKYELNTTIPTDLALPEGAQVLDIQMQNEKPVLWARVNVNAKTVQRTFVPVPTGADPTHLEPAKYIKTVQFLKGALVFHFYELKKRGERNGNESSE